jgi:LysM repeat protein
MSYAKLLVVCIFTFLSTYSANATYVQDSLGLEKHGDKVFIIHKVEAKETLFALSRRYKVTVQDINAANPELKEGLKIGQTLKIPYINEKVVEKSKSAHVVQPSETLFSISKKYKVSVEDIKKWNGLPNNEIFIGQELVVYKEGPGAAYQGALSESEKTEKPVVVFDERRGELTHKVSPGETLFSISRKYEVSVDDIKKWNALLSNEISIDQILVVGSPGETVKYDPKESSPAVEEKMDAVLASDPPVAEERKPEVITPIEVLESKEIAKPSMPITEPLDENMNSRKIIELGLAEVIEGVSDNKKYLALHRTAPIGTIMQVRNEMNNTSVFVRVVGKLPNTGDNSKVLIKLSKTAYDKLGAVNARFPVEISYFPKGL